MELLNVMSGSSHGELFFLYPKPGNRNKTWRPSWKQVMEKRLPDQQIYFWDLPVVQFTKKDGDLYYGHHIDTCIVQGLADTSEDS